MGIALEDLWAKCEACGGEGLIGGAPLPSPPGGSRPGTSATPAGRICHSCNGKGEKPTAAGEAILKFIAKVKESGRMI